MQVNWRENKHLIASTAVHAAVILYALVSFSAKPLEASASAGMPVDVISSSQFDQMLKKTTAPPKAVVEKKGENKPLPIRDAEISDMPEIVAPAPQASPPPPPPPEEKPPPEPKKEVAKPPPPVAEKKEPPPPEKPDAKSLARAALEKQKAEAAKKAAAERAEAKRQEEVKRRAEAKRIEEAKRREEAKRAEERAKLAKLAEEKPPSPDKSNFDSNSIQALLDKRNPRRMAATGDVVNTASSAPIAGAAGPTMNGNDWNRFVARMQQCWTPPDGQDVRNIAVVLRIRMNKDGTLAAEPQLVDRPSGGSFQVAADAALRAVKGCAPYTFMPVAKYDHWKDFEINFDPKNMNRG